MDPDIESVEGFTMHSVDEDDEDDDMAKKPSCFLRHSEWGMHNSRMIQARSPTSWPTAKIWM